MQRVFNQQQIVDSKGKHHGKENQDRQFEKEKDTKNTVKFAQVQALVCCNSISFTIKRLNLACLRCKGPTVTPH
jgi:hypothetical protein